jgi:hypothetical protein
LKNNNPKALAKDSAEREVALALKRPLVEEHWAWAEQSLFAVRSRMMVPVPCNLTTTDLWEYEHNNRARAPHTNGPLDVPRCGTLSLLQKPLHYREG